ncbi:MAG: hypothetical protein WAN14_22180 [Candidatus Acidiferrales bacterium]
MTTTAAARTERELAALTAACLRGLPLTINKTYKREAPDFLVETPTGPIGIEVTEVQPMPRDPSFSSPAGESAFQADCVARSEEIYMDYLVADPVKVSTYPWRMERSRKHKECMATELAEFVYKNSSAANPVANFDRHDGVPEGFSVVNIQAGTGPWVSWDAWAIHLDDIFSQIGARIADKNARLPTYRANLPGTPVWLLLFSSIDGVRGVPLPADIHAKRFPFDFDRVFFYAALSERVEELRRAD